MEETQALTEGTDAEAEVCDPPGRNTSARPSTGHAGHDNCQADAGTRRADSWTMAARAATGARQARRPGAPLALPGDICHEPVEPADASNVLWGPLVVVVRGPGRCGD